MLRGFPFLHSDILMLFFLQNICYEYGWVNRCLFFYFYFSFNEVEGERLSQAFKTVTGVKRERERDMGGKYEQIHREIVARMGGGKKVKRATNPEKLHF